MAGSRLLLLVALGPVRATPPTKALSLLVLPAPLSLVSDCLAVLLLREENFDFSQEETLDSPLGSLVEVEGPVMVVCVVEVGAILGVTGVTGSVCLTGFASVVGFVVIVVDGSTSSFGALLVLRGSAVGSGTAAACPSIPEGVTSGIGGGSSVTTGAASTRSATSSA